MARASAPSAPALLALVFAALLAVASAHTDYYESLGIATDADDAAIKKAYRKLSLKYHPGACAHARVCARARARNAAARRAWPADRLVRVGRAGVCARAHARLARGTLRDTPEPPRR